MSNKNNKLYQMNSFIKLILFILSTIITILNNNILTFVLLFFELIMLLSLIKSQIKVLIKYILNVPFIIIMFLVFLYSKSLCLVLFIIYLKLLILLITTLPTHLVLSILKIFYPLTYLKINTKKIVRLMIYIILYIKLFILNIKNLIKQYKYQSVNIFKTILKNKKAIILYIIYLTRNDVNNSLQELDFDLNINIKSQLYGEKIANFKDYLLVALYIGIIVLSLTKEVFVV